MDASKMLKAVGKPPFIYGTAWKKENTTRLVNEALSAGFRAIDTAAQPKHYQEHLVGDALREIFECGNLTRDQIFLQTKFTSPNGQDLRNMPYDPKLPVAQQVHISIASSLQNLRPKSAPDSVEESYIDCLLLHSPLRTFEDTMEAWRTMESYVPAKVRSLGISNVSMDILSALHQESTIKPLAVQNRFYADTEYDWDIRDFCKEHDIVYESFWTLTGNPRVLASEPILEIVKAVDVSRQVAMYALVMELGVVPLNGTTNAGRMKEDLKHVAKVREWSKANSDQWNQILDKFKNIIGN